MKGFMSLNLKPQRKQIIEKKDSKLDKRLPTFYKRNQIGVNIAHSS